MKRFLILAVLFALSLQQDLITRSFDGLDGPPQRLKGSQVVFVNEGELANMIGFVHVRMVFKLGVTRDSIKRAQSNLQQSIDEEKAKISEETLLLQDNSTRVIGKAKNNLSTSSIYLFLLKSVSKRIGDFYNRFTDILIGLPNSAEENLASKNLYHTRDQRSATSSDNNALGHGFSDLQEHRERRSLVAVIGAILGLGGTILGGISLSRLQELHTKFGHLERDHNKLVDIVDAQGDALSDLNLDVGVIRELLTFMKSRDSGLILTMANRATDHITDIKDRIEATIEAAQSQRLSPRAVNGPLLIRLWEHLKEIAFKENYDLMLNHPSDLYQLESSFVYDAEKMEFILFVHVPMFPPENKFTLYRYAPFPMVHPANPNLTQIVDVGEETYLALNADNEYRIMSTIDVNACTKRGTIFFCTERNAVYRDLEETCLGALYQKESAKVLQHCKFQSKIPSEFVLASGGRRWLIYSPESQTISAKCRKRVDSSAPIKIKGQVALSLMEGCTLKLKRSIISADSNFNTEMVIYYGSIEDDLFQGTGAVSLAAGADSIDWGFGNYTHRDIGDLKSFEFQSYFSKSNSILYGFIGIVLIIVIGASTYFFFKFRREARLRKSFHLESNSKERDWSEKLSALLFDSARKGATHYSAPQSKPNNSNLEVSDVVQERRSLLRNDRPSDEISLDFINTSNNPNSLNEQISSNSEKPEENNLRLRKVFFKTSDMGNVTSAAPKQNKSSKFSSGLLYPQLDDKVKTCALKQRILDRFGQFEFLCTEHDPIRGCTGVFLSPDQIANGKSLVKDLDIANE